MSLVQRFTGRMPLLTATGAFGLGRRRWSSAQQFVIYTVSVLQSTKQHLPMCLFQTTMSLLCKATASRLEQWEAADATMGLDIGHTRSAMLASTSAHSNHTAELRTPRVSHNNNNDRLTAFDPGQPG